MSSAPAAPSGARADAATVGALYDSVAACGARSLAIVGLAKNAGKTRSGRPINASALGKIFAGKPVAGPTRTRVLRAVNVILEARKKGKVELSALFDLANEPAKKGKKVEKKS